MRPPGRRDVQPAATPGCSALLRARRGMLWRQAGGARHAATRPVATSARPTGSRTLAAAARTESASSGAGSAGKGLLPFAIEALAPRA